jgi:hypothetical protein
MSNKGGNGDLPKLVAVYNERLRRWEIRVRGPSGSSGNLWHGPYRFRTYTQCVNAIKRFRGETNG